MNKRPHASGTRLTIITSSTSQVRCTTLYIQGSRHRRFVWISFVHRCLVAREWTANSQFTSQVTEFQFEKLNWNINIFIFSSRNWICSLEHCMSTLSPNGLILQVCLLIDRSCVWFDTTRVSNLSQIVKTSSETAQANENETNWSILAWMQRYDVQPPRLMIDHAHRGMESHIWLMKGQHLTNSYDYLFTILPGSHFIFF